MGAGEFSEDLHKSVNIKEGVSDIPFNYTMCKFVCRTSVNRLFTSEADNSFQE